MPTVAVLLRDPWLQGCALVGAVLTAVSVIVGVPWPLWFALAYVAALSLADHVPPRDTGHGQPTEHLWQTHPDE